MSKTKRILLTLLAMFFLLFGAYGLYAALAASPVDKLQIRYEQELATANQLIEAAAQAKERTCLVYDALRAQKKLEGIELQDKNGQCAFR